MCLKPIFDLLFIVCEFHFIFAREGALGAMRPRHRLFVGATRLAGTPLEQEKDNAVSPQAGDGPAFCRPASPG